MLGAVDLLLNYLSKSSLVTLVVLAWLSLYFIISFTVLFSRYIGLKAWMSREKMALEIALMGKSGIAENSILKLAVSSDSAINEDRLSVAISLAESRATSGLTILAIIASTSPFIGLFGTVVSILETFAGLGSGSASLGVIAPAISEALVATGCGIFVAIPAYSFNLLLKRQAYELLSVIKRSAKMIASEAA